MSTREEMLSRLDDVEGDEVRDAIRAARLLDARVEECLFDAKWEADEDGRRLVMPDGQRAAEIFRDGRPWFLFSRNMPRYSTDWNDAMKIEEEIERRGLVDRYVFALRRELWPDTVARNNAWTIVDQFRFLRATPKQRCHAVLSVFDAAESPRGHSA